jgi:hypothetical protein
MTTKQSNELNRHPVFIEMENKEYSQTLSLVIERNAVNDHMMLVHDCKNRLSALAAELGAENHKVCWSISDEYGDGKTEYDCSISIQMPRHSMGSYVNADHQFEKAEASIREMYAKYTQEEILRKRRAEDERIKQALYDDYLAQKSSTKS